MNYITVLQLSERWQVTPRYIQNLCRNGRLPGAKQFGKAWMLPEDTPHPADRRRKNAVEFRIPAALSDEICRSVPVASYRVPGTAEETIRALSGESEAAALTRAQFAYLQGNIDAAASLAKVLLKSTEDFEIKMGAAFVAGVCAMYSAEVGRWLEARTILEAIPCPDESYRARKELWLAVYGASIYDMSGYPDWFRRGCFDALPLGYYPAARVHYIKYIYIRADALVKNQPLNENDFNGQLFLLPAICEPLISQTAAEKAIVSEIYLRLMCAACYHHAGKDAAAIVHIDRALALALPDRLLAPLAEQRLNLDLLIDERMKRLDAGALADMKALHERLMNGWSKIHNAVLHRSHTNALTARELEAARLAVFGLKNKEIADRMRVSLNSVKSYLHIAMEKTGAKKRFELADYI